MDSFIYQKSVSPPDGHDFIFEKKTWVEIPDSNGASYSSGKVVFNLDNISNSGTDYFNAKESLVMIPLNLCVEVTNTTAGAAASLLAVPANLASNFIASLKNGSHQIIDKINYKINNNELITIDSFENIKIQYKLLSTWSQDNVAKRGDELHFGKDSALSFSYDAVQGVTNNAILDSAFSPLTGYGAMANKGRQERMKRTSYGVASTGGMINAVATMTDKYQDVCQVNTVGAVTTINYSIMCSFRLGDLHPLFEALPLCKNLSQYLSLTLNINSLQQLAVAVTTAATNAVASVQFVPGITVGGSESGQVVQAVQAVAAAAAQPAVWTVGVPVTSNNTNTCPYQLSPISPNADTGFRIISTACSGIVKSQLSVKQVPITVIAGSIPHTMTQCVFQACFVKMTAESDEHYSRVPSKEIAWLECYAQYGGGLANIAPSSQVNQIISGAFPKLRKIVILPFLSVASNGTSGLSPLNSTFASEPATCSAFVGNAAVSYMNVRLGVNNVYPKDIQYAWEDYLQTAQGDGAINGGLENGMSCGLISQSDWESAYGYRVIDLSRHELANDLQPQNISVKFKNESIKTMDYIVLVYYEKTCGLDTQKGLLETFKY